MLHKYPFYLKSTIILFGIILLIYALFTLQDILIPISFAALLAVLLNPLANKFERWGLKKVLAISLTVIIALIVILGIGYFLTSQIVGFSDELPLLKRKVSELSLQFQHEIKNHFGINFHKQNQFLHDADKDMKALMGRALGNIIGGMAMVVLLPVYTFLFLFYKKLLLNFMYEVFSEENSKEVGLVLKQTQGAVQSYMMGLLFEMLIVASLNSASLFLLDVKYALLIGVLGAIINVLPYVGGLVSIAMPLIIATITKDGFHTQIGIIVVYVIIQFIDNHFLIPYIVSSKVRINALISIVGVLLGGALWGVAGMFLSIPFLGVLKIILDKVPELKPWGKLLGDQVPTRHKGQVWNFSKQDSIPPETM